MKNIITWSGYFIIFLINLILIFWGISNTYFLNVVDKNKAIYFSTESITFVFCLINIVILSIIPIVLRYKDSINIINKFINKSSELAHGLNILEDMNSNVVSFATRQEELALIEKKLVTSLNDSTRDLRSNLSLFSKILNDQVKEEVLKRHSIIENILSFIDGMESRLNKTQANTADFNQLTYLLEKLKNSLKQIGLTYISPDTFDELTCDVANDNNSANLSADIEKVIKEAIFYEGNVLKNRKALVLLRVKTNSGNLETGKLKPEVIPLSVERPSFLNKIKNILTKRVIK